MTTAADKVRAANAPYRDRIVATKRALRERITDLPQRFAAMTERVQRQLDAIERERAAGTEPVPQIEFSALERISDADKARIRQRGCVVIRHVFDDARVADWNAELASYLERNDYLAKLQAGGAVDNYFNTLASGRPQIYGVFWSRPQMEARTDPAMAQAHSFLNRLWRFEHADAPGGQVFNPDANLLYADRVRCRQPGDASLGLSAHVDAGSIERWIDPAYRD
jgi:hypothetical protein